MKPTKGQGLVIDGSLHQGQKLTSRQLGERLLLLPVRVEEPMKKTQSYSTVVEQAVMTQDRPLLRQILLQCEAPLIQATVSQLNSSKVSGLLSLTEEFINADSKNTSQYCYWIKEIVIRHLGVLVSNHDNIEVVGRLRKLAQKTIQQKSRLIQLASRLRVVSSQPNQKQFVPRFNYAQGKEEPIEQELMGSEIDVEGMLDDEDLMGELYE